ncbi:TldD/PmbA family protein [Pyrococcus abyssi]|uniref:Pmba protein (Tlde protein) n=1 Tax=Pyrococcus abyssi (strain GE5 / Orsay) TaxID=272844 RepID=Q9V245_PYRAB|nr:TldD/PmbA family protein [Pyrococcus abyssi]CAB49153.1 tldD-like modulator of DNA gyrase, tldD protein homolog [Pyrococcus abyssi GE5]CCE69605.1 TPA: pmba protein (tlde protein) [Pyrococcus abyssi GE5]
MREDVEKLIKILEGSNLNLEWEIYWGVSSSSSFKFRKIRKVEVERGSFEVSGGIGLRVLTQGKIGFSYISGSNFTREQLERLVKRAYKIAKVAGSIYPGFPVPKKFPNVRGLYDDKIRNLSTEEIVEYGTELVDVPPNAEASIGLSTSERGIMNSNGTEGREERTLLAFGLYVFEKSKGTGSYSKSFRRLPKLESEIEGVREKALWEFEMSSKARKLEKYNGEIILEPKAVASILSIFLPNVSARNVYLKRSRFTELGIEVASGGLTIIDDPTVEGGINSYSFDGEGNPGVRKFIIKEGILSSFLADQKYGHLIGIGSTGNASRGYSSQPSISPSNIMISPGNDEQDEGIFIRGIYGEHTANSVSGDFSLNVDLGYVVRGGEIRPFKGNMLVGNVFEMLKNVTNIGKEIEILDGFASPKITTVGKIV